VAFAAGVSPLCRQLRRGASKSWRRRRALFAYAATRACAESSAIIMAGKSVLVSSFTEKAQRSARIGQIPMRVLWCHTSLLECQSCHRVSSHRKSLSSRTAALLTCACLLKSRNGWRQSARSVASSQRRRENACCRLSEVRPAGRHSNHKINRLRSAFLARSPTCLCT